MVVHRTHDTTSGHLEISDLLLEAREGEASLLPEFLLKLSSASMRSMNGEPFRPRDVSIFDLGLLEDNPEEPALMVLPDGEGYHAIPVPPAREKVPVVAVDVSSIRIGETSNGVLCAIRGAYVWRERSGYRYVRCGPLTFYLGNGQRDVLSKSLGLNNALIDASSFWMADRVLTRLRNMLERWIQGGVCSLFRNAIVLFDGSLTAGTPDNPAKHVERILDTAKERGNTVLAFSKATKLCAFGSKITSLIQDSRAPCILDVDSLVMKQFPSHPVRSLGRIYVCKLAEHGFAFRLDIDRQIPEDGGANAVSQLVSSDLVDQGYPETLRLAHILSTFTANEVIGIQRYAASAYGLTIAPRTSLRRSLFGPFGTSRQVA